MKLLLTSAGFYTPEIAAKCAELVGKPSADINVAVINEGYAVEFGDHGWVLDDLNRIKTYFKGRMELINLLALDQKRVQERLELADVVFVVGGCTDYLMSVFVKTGFADMLPELLKTKVYVGSSAGSMVIGRRVSTDAYARIYGHGNDYGVSRYMELVDFALKPHLNSKLFLQNRQDALLEVAQDFAGTLYGICDDTAIVVDGSKQYTIGGEPVTIVNGKVA